MLIPNCYSPFPPHTQPFSKQHQLESQPQHPVSWPFHSPWPSSGAATLYTTLFGCINIKTKESCAFVGVWFPSLRRIYAWVSDLLLPTDVHCRDPLGYTLMIMSPILLSIGLLMRVIIISYDIKTKGKRCTLLSISPHYLEQQQNGNITINLPLMIVELL